MGKTRKYRQKQDTKMKLKVLASGSSGNCYILESPTGSLVIELGLPWREVLKGLNFDLSSVVGAIVSHEHLDHSKAISKALKAGIDVWASEGTADTLSIKHYRLNRAESRQQFKIGDFLILVFETEHDATEPLGFLIQYIPTGYRLLFATDTYYLKYKFRNLHGIAIECNYIKETLDENIENGYISQASKPRLLQSHMSLENLKEFLKANDLSNCQNIALLHLSSRNSDSKRMVEEIEKLTGIEAEVAKKGLEVDLKRLPY